MAFDLSGIIDQENGCVHTWMIDTLTMAHLASGLEANESDIRQMVKERIIDPLPQDDLNARSLTPQTMRVALEILAEGEADMEVVGRSDLISVNFWIMRSLAMSHVARQRPFNDGQLEAEADAHITSPVQGNKRSPRRTDLDLLVRRTVEYVLGQFSSVAVPVG